MSGRETWTYWICRDSLQGELSGTIHLWYRKPARVKHGYRVAWVASDHRDPGYLGAFHVDAVRAWFNVIPETDLELIKADTYPTSEQLKMRSNA